MVLTHICHQLQLDIVLAHCNFNLRGEESDADEKFVVDFGEKTGIRVLTTSFDTKAFKESFRGSIQMAARKLRYDWFEELLDAQKRDYVLTAHHADDSLETFLINLSRGTGIDGLSGIPEVNGRIVRPLLPFSRDEILEYAQENQLGWREDTSNSDTRYLRNQIRKEIAPKLKKLHLTFLQNFLRTQNHLLQSKELLNNIVEEARTKLFINQEDSIKINIAKLRELQPVEAYMYHLFQPYGFNQQEDLISLLDAMSGKEIHSKTYRLLKDRDHLLLKKHTQSESSFFLIYQGQVSLESPIPLKIKEVENLDNPAKNRVFLDKEKLNYPLLLRKWEKGDYFYPLGMEGKKKVSKFFKDEKMDVFSKENQWILCSGEDIVWIIGRRADERFKIDESTQQILKITVSE